MALIQLKGVSKIYTSGEHVLRALDNVDMSIEKGKFVVILGPSGAGKSTLLNILGARKNKKIDMVAALKAPE